MGCLSAPAARQSWLRQDHFQPPVSALGHCAGPESYLLALRPALVEADSAAVVAVEPYRLSTAQTLLPAVAAAEEGAASPSPGHKCYLLGAPPRSPSFCSVHTG